MKILAVCGNGLGSSLFIAQNIDAVCRANDIDAIVEAIDLSSAQNMEADFYVGDSNIVSQINKEVVVPITNILQKSEIEEKLLPLLK